MGLRLEEEDSETRRIHIDFVQAYSTFSCDTNSAGQNDGRVGMYGQKAKQKVNLVNVERHEDFAVIWQIIWVYNISDVIIFHNYLQNYRLLRRRPKTLVAE